MKKIFMLLSVVLLATACDSPQRNRLASSVGTGNGLGEPMSGNNPWNTGTTGGNGGGTTGGTTGGNNNNNPPGFETCDISAKYYASGINYMGICQSTIDETSVSVNSTVSDTARTCLIPTYRDATGSSTYLGQPQCFAPEAGKITMGKLYKTRQGFTGNPINGVMVIKEVSITAYYTCMDAFITFTHPQCPYGANTNQQCNQMARDRMANICSAFKTGHSYIDIRLK